MKGMTQPEKMGDKDSSRKIRGFLMVPLGPPVPYGPHPKWGFSHESKHALHRTRSMVPVPFPFRVRRGCPPRGGFRHMHGQLDGTKEYTVYPRHSMYGIYQLIRPIDPLAPPPLAFSRQSLWQSQVRVWVLKATQLHVTP